MCSRSTAAVTRAWMTARGLGCLLSKLLLRGGGGVYFPSPVTGIEVLGHADGEM